MTKKKRRLGLRITIAVLLVLATIVGGVAYWQRNNIQALIESIRYTPEERRDRLNEQELALLKKISEEIPDVHVKPLSEEEAKQLLDGEITEEDAIRLITSQPLDKETAVLGTEETMPQESFKEQEQESIQETSNLENLLAQIYVLKASFTGRLDSLVGQAKQEFINGKGKVSKYAVAKKYVGIAAGLEGQCDSQMESLLSQIKAELERTGGDAAIISQIRSAYAGEKSAKKAELMDYYQ